MSSLADRDLVSLKNQIEDLKKENDLLRKELQTKQAHIRHLEDVSLTLSERDVLLGKKLPVH